LSNFILYRLQDACRQDGCPVCRVEQYNVERYLESQFYENVNSPKWRDRLRASLGFCHEHAWLIVDRRLGDSLGLSIIYRDVLNSILKKLDDGSVRAKPSRRWASLLGQIPEQTRNVVENMLDAITPARRCPVCEHREEASRTILSVLVDGLARQEMIDALQSSDGLCLPHLQRTLEKVQGKDASESLLAIHHKKLEGLKAELEEYIRKSDYREIESGFGSEGDAWLRAIALVVGRRKQV
jgi:hypothetical protein